MSKRKLKLDLDKDLEIKIKDLVGIEQRFNLVPMKTRDAQQVMHNILQPVLKPLFKLLSDHENMDQDEIINEAVEGLKSLDFDSIWFLVKMLLKSGGMINDQEIKRDSDLEECTAFRNDPTLIYRFIYEGVRANYPDVFEVLATGLRRAMAQGEQTQSESSTSTDTLAE